MFNTIGDAIDEYKRLSKDISELEATLITLRGHAFEEGIEQDKRKSVEILAAERSHSILEINKIRAIKLGGDME